MRGALLLTPGLESAIAAAAEGQDGMQLLKARSYKRCRKYLRTWSISYHSTAGVFGTVYEAVERKGPPHTRPIPFSGGDHILMEIGDPVAEITRPKYYARLVKTQQGQSIWQIRMNVGDSDCSELDKWTV
ncbi:hypothetical protein HRR83_004708 [Exophiala dermatitidis]|uniref:Uncharacterized protein n=1 Tax=Exophiala dermatitidis TaxID=5970 RepID=A0AAN6IWU8_EXODE|nr:hypothetical protein HRR74_004010 [Exophiala dermatitidis]KAJ4529085.1 hypothetical protein HRR73_000105 [Exophiala dermatitidis]KAJ4538485.1 hypothetical protein HRR77_006968 [Exophiala dermatitidis]KAJ4544269.1 hypothetical protein HRR76_002335 [Exophiala dermatitidis]KAJ4561688.1 hypothetical protein HRR79_007025 [Exophiala dermatitidis]